MSHVFISHVAEDEEVARSLAFGFEAEHYRAWFYERDALVGESHLNQTSRAIEQSAAYIIVVSESALASIQVETELVHAHETGKAIFPILLGITFEELKQRKPMWRVAIGASVALLSDRASINKDIPALLAGLRNLDILPENVTPDALRVRIVGFVSYEDGGFRLERLVGNDIAFNHTGETETLVHDACRAMLSIIIAQSGAAKPPINLKGDLVSVWYIDGQEVPPNQRVDQLPANTKVIAILNERHYPAAVLKTLLQNSKGILK